MDRIQWDIRRLAEYGVKTGLVPQEDVVYTVNRLLELFGLEELQEQEMPGGAPADTLGGQESGDRTWSGTEPGESTGAHGSAQSGQETCAGRKS